MRVVIVGAGIAGVAAALRLAEQGASVTLLETRKKLGGRATSFVDARTGETLDNCQHVALRCCTNYLDLCRRLGALGKLRWTDQIHFVEPGGRVSTLRPCLLPAPGHMTGSFLAAAFLSLPEKLAIARAILILPSEKRDLWKARTFGAWLRERDQPEGAIRKFWAPVIVSACNLGVERVCAASALHVFQDGFLANRRAADMAVAAVPLVELYDPAEQAIEAAGGAIRLGASVERVLERSVRLASGETIEADAVVCATPPERTIRIVDESIQRRDARFARLGEITHSPIIGAHLFFDRPVMRIPHATLVDRETQWLFRKDDEGRKLHAVVSGADRWVALPEERIAELVRADVEACFPDAAGAKLEAVRVVKEKLATFACTPEAEAIRPSARGASALILAGCYTDTGWPATMEGAARSGYVAAAATLGKDDAWALAPAMPEALGYRALGALA